MDFPTLSVVAILLITIDHTTANCFESIPGPSPYRSVDPVTCVFDNQTYQPGETWVHDPCMNCSCSQAGAYRCCGYGIYAGPGLFVIGCAVNRLDCHTGELLDEVPGSCPRSGQLVHVP
ncbi:uncharacterized protein [Argopecten irradians]|uniref:uncharacterized protein n=1 Tax=Argopecten irradians TaxID=31199 RepID=UPI003714C9DD